jgi:hypothetical protein
MGITPKAGIFISYRREDTDYIAGRIAEGLSKRFGPDSIFRDVENLSPGVNYENALDRALNSCAVLVAVIGPNWSSITDKAGRRRLDDPQDWVRAEISRALEREIPVVPVLLSGTSMPQDADLPCEMKKLLKHQTCELTDLHWKRDLDRLTESLSKIVKIPKKNNLWKLLIGVALLIVGILAYTLILRSPDSQEICGQIVEEGSGVSLDGAMVQMVSSSMSIKSKDGGQFCLKVKGNCGEYVPLRIKMDGYDPLTEGYQVCAKDFKLQLKKIKK